MSRFLNYYIAISTFYLLLFLFGQDDFAWYFKPFLMPFLILATYKFSFFSTKKWLLLALIFSWIGDVLLMFSSKEELFYTRFGFLSDGSCFVYPTFYPAKKRRTIC